MLRVGNISGMRSWLCVCGNRNEDHASTVFQRCLRCDRTRGHNSQPTLGRPQIREAQRLNAWLCNRCLNLNQASDDECYIACRAPKPPPLERVQGREVGLYTRDWPENVRSRLEAANRRRADAPPGVGEWGTPVTREHRPEYHQAMQPPAPGYPARAPEMDEEYDEYDMAGAAGQPRGAFNNQPEHYGPARGQARPEYDEQEADYHQPQGYAQAPSHHYDNEDVYDPRGHAPAPARGYGQEVNYQPGRATQRPVQRYNEEYYEEPEEYDPQQGHAGYGQQQRHAQAAPAGGSIDDILDNWVDQSGWRVEEGTGDQVKYEYGPDGLLYEVARQSARRRR